MLTADELKNLDAKDKSDAKSDAKAGYDIALKLTDSVSRTIWSQYVAMLATNAFLLSVGGFLYDEPKFTAIAGVALPVLGLVVCVSWFFLTVRSYDYYKYYFACARELEWLAFGDVVHTIRNGKNFSEGKLVDVRVITHPQDLQAIKLSDFERKLRLSNPFVRAESVTYLIIAAFIGVYVALFFLMR